MFDVQKLTLNNDEAKELSKAIFEHTLQYPEITKYHDVHTGINYNTQIPFIGTLGLVGKEIIKCKPDANGNKIPLSEKVWTPKLIGDRFEHCSVDGDPLLKLFKKVKQINPDFYDKIDSEELGIVLMRISTSLKDMINRSIWFGDTAASAIADGGVITDGTDLGFFNMFDGFWKQIITKDITTASKQYVKIDANDGDDYETQENLANDFAFNLFRKMWSKSDARLKQLVMNSGINLQIHCTSKIAENWQDFKEDKSLAFTLDKAEGGGLKNAFRNIEIVPRYDWDSVISGYQDNGTKLNLPNRALLTTPSNIPIGTINVTDLDKVESFYDKYHRVNVMDFSLMLDAKFLEDYLAVVAY